MSKTMSDEHNILNRIAAQSDEPQITGSTIEIFSVPLELITPREKNEYSMENLEALAQDIRKNGLINPVVLCPNPDKQGSRYLLIDGERRFRAMQMLAQQDPEGGWSRIDARIRKQDSEAIYRGANDTARDNTLFERIYRYHPSLHTFDDPQVREEYAAMKHGRTKFKETEIPDYINFRFQKDYPHLEVAGDTVRKYTRTILRLHDDVCMAALKGILTTSQAHRMAALDPNRQLELLQQIQDGADADAVLSTAGDRGSQDKADATPSRTIYDSARRLIRTRDTLSECLTVRKKDLTGNQKEILKQIQKIIKAIDTLETLPK